jgi:hypothetical protein
VFPGQAAKDDRDAVALGRRERPLWLTMKVRRDPSGRGFTFKPPPLCSEPVGGG